MEVGYPRVGKPYPDQETISCPSYGRLLHARCATTISGHHPWLTRMRAFVREHVHLEVASCRECCARMPPGHLGGCSSMMAVIAMQAVPTTGAPPG